MDPSLMRALLVMAVVLAALPLCFPLMTLLMVRARIDADILPFDPAATPVPAPFIEHFQTADDALTNLGFRYLGGYVIADMTAFTRAILQLYVHDYQRDIAIAGAVYASSQGGVGTVRTQYIDFDARFTGNGVCAVQTTNSPDEAFAPVPRYVKSRFPHIRDAVHLYALHRALVHRHAGRQAKTVEIFDKYGGDAIAYLRESEIAETLRNQEQTGYFRYHASQGYWSPTLKGAYLMTWKQLFPIKQWRRFFLHRQARKLESELVVPSGWF